MSQDCVNAQKVLQRQDSTASHSSDTSEGSVKDASMPLKVRGGALKRPAGYQPDLVCLVPWSTHGICPLITAIAINSAYGL